jgi:iron(III) transport system permease protein
MAVPAGLVARKDKGGPGQWLALAAYAIVVLGPVLALAAATLQALAGGHLEWLELAIPLGRRATLCLNSIGLALGVSSLTVILGGVGATLLWSWRRQAAGVLLWLVLPLVALPPYVHALAWLSVADTVGDALRPLGLSLGALQGWAGTLWVEVAAFSPLALGCAWLGVRSIDPELIEAGRAARSDLQTLIRIVLPLAAPALLTGGGIVFLLSLLDYSVPSLFQVHVYAMEVFAEFSASHDPARACLMAAPLLVLAVAVIAAVLEPLRGLTARVGLHRAAWASPPRWPAWLAVSQGVVVALLILQALAPFTVMIGLNSNLPRFLATVAQARRELSYSLSMAAGAAVLSLPTAALAVRSLLRPGRFSRARWFLVIAPLAVPASVVGIGLTRLSNQPWLSGDIAGYVMPALASVARFAPLAGLILLAQLRRRDPLLLEAARVFQPSWWRRQAQVALPLVAPGLLAGAGLVFALSMGELGATLMVVPPGQATLTMRIYSYLHYGASDTVAGLCLVLAGGVLAAGLLAAAAAALWSRLSASPEVPA